MNVFGHNMTWLGDGNREGCRFIICSKQMTVPAPDPGGNSRFLVGDLQMSRVAKVGSL